MYQTGYKGYTTLAKGLPYMGGFCKWYYIDKAQLTAFPAIDPKTQYLTSEPTIAGAWCGPVIVPNDQLGYEETPKRDNAGLYFQHKVSGFHPGDNPSSRINIENMHYYEMVIVGKMRAGGMYLLIGNKDHGLNFDASFSSATKATAGDAFTFTANLLNKAYVLPTFGGQDTIPPENGGGGGTDNGGGGSGSGTNMNNVEVFPYTSEAYMQIPWNLARQDIFGIFPTIEVWYSEGGTLRLNTAAVIIVDALPPNTTLFTIYFNAPGPGIVVIK